VRIVAGRWRNRRLAVPAGLSTRPTSDKTREAIFDILGDVREAIVADLFAGSGALGIEALSRGAGRLILVDRSNRAVRCIRSNLNSLDAGPQARVIRRDLSRGFSFLVEFGPFDLILADPPYSKGWVKRLLNRLPERLLSPDGRLIIESDLKEAPAETRPWSLLRQRRYGQTAITIFTLEGE
jgi:16S rRNA (guanine(966)-N(2))-methyltransferase RsmD